MSEFDKLLAEIAAEDANANPPEGMESRIALAISAITERAPNGRKFRFQAVAAAGLIGLAWMLMHKRVSPAVAVAMPVGQVSLVAAATVQTALADRKSAATQELPAAGRVRVSFKVPNFPVSIEGNAIRITPLVIEPLAVQPIEIASLTSTNANRNGEAR